MRKSQVMEDFVLMMAHGTRKGGDTVINPKSEDAYDTQYMLMANGEKI